MELLKNQMQPKNKAFSLIEAVIITFIVSFLALVPSIYLKGYQEANNLLLAKRQVKTAINSAARWALLNKKVVEFTPITNDPQTGAQRISVLRRDSHGKQANYILKMPKGVKVSNIFRLSVSKNGSITPRTITIRNSKGKVKIKIQMKWGKLVDE